MKKTPYHAALINSRPTLFIDLDALKQNIQWVTKEAKNKRIRIATKSLRSRKLIQLIQLSSDIFQGLMTFSLEEALWLREQGFDDILMGYPTTDERELRQLARNPSGIVLMVDRAEHLLLLERIGKETSCTFSICVDVDLSLDLPGVRFGVYRSQIHSLGDLTAFLETLGKCHHIELTGLMGYEAQIAGVMDDKSRMMQTLKRISLKDLQRKRQKMVELIEKYGHKLSIINGGGTGSLKYTREESVVTEITVGSAFYAPVLFDHYRDFKLTPGLYFALPVVRRPARDIVTVLGGGYIASGELGEIKQPKVVWPSQARYLKHEGFGEVQTPLRLGTGEDVQIGEMVIFRHAKAGEICERFNLIEMLENGKKIDTALTYRGEGKAFL
jgi:D-serine deaminase-like pyridoxal phosphate-dependent protein